MPQRIMHIFEFERRVELEVKAAVEKYLQFDWREDLITHELAIGFRNRFKDLVLHGLRVPLQMEWQAYKLYGTRETNHGDIGLLFRHRRSDGTTVEGAGFLEAKLRDRRSNRFGSVRQLQMQRLARRSPHTRLLLYDYNPIAVLDTDHLAGPWDDFPYAIRSRPMHSRVTHGAVIPLPLAKVLGKYDDTMYPFCSSLAFQLSRRYFNLHDLDFRKKAVDAVKGFPSQYGNPAIILIVRSAPEGQELPEAAPPNNNLFRSIDDSPVDE